MIIKYLFVKNRAQKRMQRYDLYRCKQKYLSFILTFLTVFQRHFLGYLSSEEMVKMPDIVVFRPFHKRKSLSALAPRLSSSISMAATYSPA